MFIDIFEFLCDYVKWVVLLHITMILLKNLICIGFMCVHMHVMEVWRSEGNLRE